jgi:hypothetical protein
MYSWASQDPDHYLSGRLVHPSNIETSFAKILSDMLHHPLKLEAWERNCHSKIIRETHHALDTLPIKWAVITWPNFFRSEIEHDGTSYQFEFNKIDFYDVSDDVKALMKSHIRAFHMDTVKSQFIEELKNLCDRFNSMGVKYSMIMSDSNIYPIMAEWLLDPANQHLVGWASQKEMINGAGYLTVNGHRELAKSLIVHLTNQL